MDEAKLRELLPGSGDLAEMVREVMEEQNFFSSEDAAELEFSDEMGKYLLDKIIDWINSDA